MIVHDSEIGSKTSQKYVYEQRKRIKNGVEVYHEGIEIVFRFLVDVRPSAMIIPVRSGFPMNGSKNRSGLFALVDSQGRHVGAAKRVPDGILISTVCGIRAGEYSVHLDQTLGSA